jgi:hypothetical protein
MLNKLLHSSLGFAWTVRVAAFAVLGCLAVANMLIRPRVKPSAISLSVFDQLKVLFTDVPYLFLIVGCVCRPSFAQGHANTSHYIQRFRDIDWHVLPMYVFPPDFQWRSRISSNSSCLVIFLISRFLYTDLCTYARHP